MSTSESPLHEMSGCAANVPLKKVRLHEMSSCATGQCPLQTSKFSYTQSSLLPTASCSTGGCKAKSCSACPAPRQVVATPTEVVFTPYHQTFGTEEPTEGGDYPRPNFTNYDVFCLKTKLTNTVRALGSDYDTTFTGYELDGVVRYAVELTRGGRLAALSEEQAPLLEAAVQAATSVYPTHCLLFSAALPLTYQGEHYPQAWLAGVLPFAQVDESYSPVFDGGALYIDLSDYEDYLSVWERLHFSLVDQLRAMYKQGYVVCHPQFDATCIENWALTPALGAGRDSAALYRPEWRDTRFAPCPARFLRQRLGGSETISLRVPADPVARHFVASALYKVGMGRDFSFAGSHCLLLCRSLERALFAANLVGAASSAASSAVARATTLLSSLYKEPTEVGENINVNVNADGNVDVNSDGNGKSGAKAAVQDEVCYAVEDETAPFVISVLVYL